MVEKQQLSVIEQLKLCLKHEKFRKLLAVRLVSQTGDGMFQVGLATLFIFNPTSMTTATGVAAAFAVLLLPFTVVGPFAGPLLDRWSRRQVLVYGNLIRTILALFLSGIVLVVSSDHWILYVLALVTLGVNRFLLSGLSAGLPHTLPRELLVMANSITPTLGSIASVVGAALGLVLSFLVPEGAIRNAVALLTAAVLFFSASALARRFQRDELGPTEKPTTSVWKDMSQVINDMVDGAKYLIKRGTPAYGLGIMAIHRFLYGVNFIALILVSRNLMADPMDAEAGMAQFALIGGVSFIGNGLAIVLTPIAHQRMSPSKWIMVCLGLSMISQGILVVTWHKPWIFISAILLGLGVQGAKIAVDTIVQRDTDDRYRGRAFSFYDMMYNSAFVAAAVLAALFLPDTGWSPEVFLGLTFVYVIAAAWYWRKVSAIGEQPREV